MKKTQNVDLNSYQEFVSVVTSEASNSMAEMISRIEALENTYGVNMSLLMTAGFGLSSEGGEFGEIIKKAVFQGKPLDADVQFHLKRELGDIIFYWITGCRALGLDPNAVIEENVNKLEARYPGGKFTVEKSENRKSGDL
jgi:NTP pyrophosphatase (non-canonical NTP hydrolase)